MEYLVIRFPFSSVNDEQYTLALVVNGGELREVVDYLSNKERKLFRHIADSTDGSDTIYNYEGTLTGAVKAADDERENIFEPLVCSKLSFNMAVQNFPNWLMDYCDNNRVKAIVYKVEDGPTYCEMWRGYLVAQSLNMTVVNDYLSVALVAVDEVAMAKYINFRESVAAVSSVRWCSLYDLMLIYYILHYTNGLSSASIGFIRSYQILGLTASHKMLWHRNLRILDDDGNDITDLPNTINVNLDRWLTDEEATWEKVFTELFEYLGVTFAVGSFEGITGNDAYLLSNPVDPGTVTQYIYTFTSGTAEDVEDSQFATFNNPTKVGGNVQLTSEPQQYRKTLVRSVPKRWETHEYLTNEHYKDVGQDSVKHEWGTTQNPTDGPYETFEWHKLKYIEPDDKEADYLTIPDCVNGEGYLMAMDGDLPYDDINSCDGKTKPDAFCAGSLDFLTFKEGACCVKLGNGTISGIDEDKMLKAYFIIMNHMWGRMINAGNHTMSERMHISDTPWLKFRPLGLAGGVHPSEKHFLKISMDVMFIRENFPVGSMKDGDPYQHNWLPAAAYGQPMQPINWYRPPMIMPITDTVFDFETDGGPYHGGYNASLNGWTDLHFSAYIHVGNHYFDGYNWQYITPGNTKPKCIVIMKNSTTNTDNIDKFGTYHLKTANYYYTISNPCIGNISVGDDSQNALLSSLNGVSIHGQPVHGQLEMEILGQINFISYFQSVGQSIPFVLIRDVNITYTDEAEFTGKDIDNKVEQVMDENSKTKETLEKELAMATPSVDGFFNNCLLFDGGKAWHNITSVRRQTYSVATTLEKLRCNDLAVQYSNEQLFVELSTPVAFDDNVHNVGFKVYGLTEADGDFMPVKREFDFTRETMRVKLARVNNIIYN